MDQIVDMMKAQPQAVRSAALNKHAVRAAQHFSRRVDLFQKIVLSNTCMWDGHRPVDHWIRVEFQLRGVLHYFSTLLSGSPHIHMLIWFDSGISDLSLHMAIERIQNIAHLINYIPVVYSDESIAQYRRYCAINTIMIR